MRRSVELALGVGAVAVVMLLFLLPVVSITVQADCLVTPPDGSICRPDTSSAHVTLEAADANASIAYAYLGIGAVQVPGPNSGQYRYCLVSGDPGTMCGLPWQLNVGLPRYENATTSG